MTCSGASRLHVPAIARPSARPASCDHALAAEVALARHRDDAAQREPVAVAAAQRLEDRLGAGERLQAAAVAAAADRPALVDRHVADLAGGARPRPGTGGR